MKKLIILTAFLYAMTAYSQNPIYLTYGHIEIDFEDTSQFKYVLMDTSVWHIAIPNKNILSMSSKALVTDTSLYYTNNLISSFQFKLVLGEADAFSINFYHKFDFEKNKDGGIIETSYNNGQTWHNILFDTLIRPAVLLAFEGFYNSSDIISSYNNQPGFTDLKSELTFSNYIFIPDYSIRGDTMLLRFTIASDPMVSPNEGWVLDNISFGGHGFYNVNDIKQKSELNIYPNPVYSMLNIEIEKEIITNVDVFSVTGQLLTSKSGNSINYIYMDDLQNGLYIVKCKNSNSQIWISKINKL